MAIPLVTLDFETYYDNTYSLKEITTEEYVRSKKFQIIGVGIKWQGKPAEWYSFDTEQEYVELLQPLNNAMVLCHNTMFDGAILSWRFGVRPKFWLDTFSMARPLHGAIIGGSLKALAEHYGIGVKGTEVIAAKGKRREDFSINELKQYGEYCKNDVELTYKLFGKLRKQLPVSELQLIDATIRLFTEPMLHFDSKVLKDHLQVIQQKKSELLQQVEEIAGKDALMSNPQLANILRALGVEPPIKISPRTGKETYAFGKTDKEFTALLEHEDPRVQAVVAARLGVKSTIEETRIERFLAMAERGPLPVPLMYAGAMTTWRWSGAEKVNLQNLPRGSALRKAVKAPPGYKLVACDLSNIELRINHALAGQEDVVDALREGRDLYCEFASILFGRKITKADTKERMLGKICHLGLGYGMGWQRFKETARQSGITLTDDEAKRIVSLWRDTYSEIPKFWFSGATALGNIYYKIAAPVDAEGRVWTTSDGLATPPQHKILYPGLTKTEDGWMYQKNKNEFVRIYGGKVVENIVQHIARNIIAEHWLKIAEQYRVVLQVHDELVVCVPENKAEEAREYMLSVMSTSPNWWPDIPLAAEAHIGDSYGDLK